MPWTKPPPLFYVRKRTAAALPLALVAVTYLCATRVTIHLNILQEICMAGCGASCNIIRGC